jgi:multidrug efflux pump subunit AcrA (membrane-fusion protein)
MRKVDELTLKIDRGEAVTPEELAQARAADDLEQLQAEAAARVAEQQVARQQEEERTAKVVQLAESAARANKLLASLEKQRRDEDAEMKKRGQQRRQTLANLRAERRTAIQLARRLAPGIFSLTLTGRRANEEELQADVDALLSELEARGSDLTAISIDWLDGGRSVLDRSYSLPSLPYSEAINLADNITARLLEKEERKSQPEEEAA